MTGLGLRSLDRLAAGVQRPRYDPSQIRIGVVHFGPGAFHRAHQGDYFDRLLESNPRWGISAVSLRSAGTVQALRAQDGLYSLSILDRDPALRVLAPHREWIGPGQEQRLKSRLVDPEVRLVTATVTEKGYCLGGNSRLDFSHPNIVHDLRYPADPRSFPGWLVAGLAARRAARLPAFTTLSCDNLGQNGRKLGGAVIALAEARDQDLARWIADETRFPNTMVDSITPASDAAFLDQLQYRLGVRDDAAVKREAFAQWVIERANGAELPDLGSVGATLTQDVAAWERAKLRILNGTHSTLAYLGLLRGHRTVDEAVQDRDLAGFVEAMVREEVWPGLARTEGLDLSAYTADVFSRFRNPAIGHQLSQIAWDGSQKLPYRLLAGIAEAIAAGRPYVRLATAVAAWMAFCTVRARHGEPITDPLADRLVEAGRVANERSSAEPFLTFTEVFSAELSAHEPFREVVNQSFRSLASASTAPLSISSLAK